MEPTEDPRFIVPPQPASQFVPQWYRDGERYINKNDGTLNIPSPEDRSAGMKLCMPFLDSIIAGYIQSTSCDIEIIKNDGGENVEYRHVIQDENGNWQDYMNLNIIGERHGDIGHTLPRPHGHSHNHMTWNGKWGWKLPRGWSAIITHPMNQHQLPFTTLSGFMDSDRFTAGGNVPFFLKEGFTGIIPKGTPMFQIIPIKREKWLGYVSNPFDKKSQYVGSLAREVPYGYYRDDIWVKKEYDVEKE